MKGYGWLSLAFGLAFFPYFFLLYPVGLSHFDEGQYAFARVWPWIDKFDVDQAFFSPPLYPFLVGLLQHLPITRPDLAGVYISYIACWASLYLGVKLAVAWWGRSAAFPAFLLLLLSPMRLAFGTIGLTDALFSALILATLLAATRAFRDRSTRWTILTGLLAGSTWSCKYNGFITLAIIAGFFFHQRSASSLFRWLVICLIAAAMIGPWFWAIHTHHPEGIEALRRHQEGYLRGLSASIVGNNLATALRLRAELSPTSILIVSWMMLLAACFSKRHWRPLLLIAVFLAIDELSRHRFFPAFAIVVLPFSMLAASPLVRLPLLLAVLTTTFLPAIYTPYVRLWLPAEHLLPLVIAGVVGRSVEQEYRWPRGWLIGVASLIALVPSAFVVLPSMAEVGRISLPQNIVDASRQYAFRPMVHPGEGYLNVARWVVDAVEQNNGKELLVYGRPPLLYYLSRSPIRIPIRRLPDLPIAIDEIPAGAILAADIAVRDSKQFARLLRDPGLHVKINALVVIRFNPHPITELDDFGAVAVQPRTQEYNDYKVNVYVLGDDSGKAE